MSTWPVRLRLLFNSPTLQLSSSHRSLSHPSVNPFQAAVSARPLHPASCISCLVLARLLTRSPPPASASLAHAPAPRSAVRLNPVSFPPVVIWAVICVPCPAASSLPVLPVLPGLPGFPAERTTYLVAPAPQATDRLDLIDDTFPSAWNRSSRWPLPIGLDRIGAIPIPHPAARARRPYRSTPTPVHKVTAKYQPSCPRLTCLPACASISRPGDTPALKPLNHHNLACLIN